MEISEMPWSFKFCGIPYYAKRVLTGLVNLGVVADSGLTVLESTDFQSRKHGTYLLVLALPWTFIWSWLNQLHGEEHSSVSVAVYLILALLGLPRTYRLLLTVRGHWHLFLGNYGDVTKHIFVQIVKKMLVLLLETWKSCFSITASFTVAISLVLLGLFVVITLKPYNQTYMCSNGQTSP